MGALRLLYAAAISVVASFAISAKPDVIITAAPTPGTDLSEVFVGDTIAIDAIGSSSDVGEHLAALPDIHIFWSSFAMQLESFVAAPPSSTI
jgi:hypothetical protein